MLEVLHTFQNQITNHAVCICNISTTSVDGWVCFISFIASF